MMDLSHVGSIAWLMTAIVIVLVCVTALVRGSNWWDYYQLRKLSWKPREREIEGYGVVRIHPMMVPMRLALIQVMSDKSADIFSVYLWLITACVVEFRGRQPEKLGIELPPDIITKLGEAVLEVSGLTGDAQESNAKKSVSTQS